MTELQERIAREGEVLPGGILKVDSFLNHQLHPGFTLRMGEEFRARFDNLEIGAVDKILTVESSGIGPAFATAAAYGVPVIFAKKSRPLTMPKSLEAIARSPTRGGQVTLHVSPEYLRRGERILVIDDFLASGHTVGALAQLVTAVGAVLLGAGFVVEKTFQGGRERLAPLKIPVVSLARIREMRDSQVVFDE